VLEKTFMHASMHTATSNIERTLSTVFLCQENESIDKAVKCTSVIRMWC